MLQLNVSARVVELVDTQDLKSCDRKIVWVQVPSRVHILGFLKEFKPFRNTENPLNRVLIIKESVTMNIPLPDLIKALLTINFLRYFLTASTVFLIFYVWKKKAWGGKKIQGTFPKLKDYQREMGLLHDHFSYFQYGRGFGHCIALASIQFGL